MVAAQRLGDAEQDEGDISFFFSSFTFFGSFFFETGSYVA